MLNRRNFNQNLLLTLGAVALPMPDFDILNWPPFDTQIWPTP